MMRFGIALCAFLFGPLAALAGDPISADMARREEFLKRQFSETYFVNLKSPDDERMAMDKTVIHIIAVAVAANLSCGLDVDVADLKAKARRMGTSGPLGYDFYAEVEQRVAADITEQLRDDEGGVCDGIYYTVEQALPFVRSDRSVAETQIAPDKAYDPLPDATDSSVLPDVIDVPVLYSSQVVKVPVHRNPQHPAEIEYIDYERMIADPAFGGQDFPDYVCPPNESGCELAYGHSVLQAKASAIDRYQPTEELCREARFRAVTQGNSQMASALHTTILGLSMASTQPQRGTDGSVEAPIVFNPMFYYVIRSAMASQVCLGLREP